MFGYVAPVLSVLSDEQKQRYRSVYCGVCHALKARHGQPGRLSLSNDMTFLALLLSSLHDRLRRGYECLAILLEV